MKIIKPSIHIEPFDGMTMLKNIEMAGRTCYKSEINITDETAPLFVKMIIARGHESVLEHEKISVRIICDRGVTHELVRHRIASYSQESTRYVNYKEGIEVIEPLDMTNKIEGAYIWWTQAMNHVERTYKDMIEAGATPQMARSVLPNCLKTEIVCTMNLREWRHFFKLRCAKAAHPQMREIALMILKEFVDKLPTVFDDIGGEYGFGKS